MHSLGCNPTFLGESNLILVLMPSMESAFYEELVRGITNAASSHGVFTVLVRTADTQLTADVLQSTMTRTNARAAILLSPIQPAQDVVLLTQTTSIVQCGAIDITDGISCVAIDETAVCRAITTYLLSQGRRRIALISGPASQRRMEQRAEGYRQACVAAPLSASCEALMQVQVANVGEVLSALEQLLGGRERPDAIFAASDEIAIAVAKAAKRLGLSIPRELGIVGLNNIGWREYSDPVLTTVHLPLYRMGFLSGELAVGGIQRTGLPPRYITVDTEILKRDS
jgi:DNA-binding LacI/PurR family transcriptional regulator